MNRILSTSLNIAAVLSSMYFQHVEPQIIWVALVFFSSAVVGELIRCFIIKRKISLRFLIQEPLIRALALFLGGTLIVSGYYSFDALKENRTKMSEAMLNQKAFETNIAHQIICNMAIDYFHDSNLIPTLELCEAMGVDNKEHLADYICGYYFLHSSPTDYLQARSYFQKAADSCPLALFNYGKMTYYGYGDIPDKDNGLKLIQESSKKAVLDAHYFLFGKAVTDNDSKKAITEYNEFQRVVCDTIHIFFENNTLFDFYDDTKRIHAYKIADDVTLQWQKSRWSLLCTMLPFCMSGNNPNEALNACDEYFNPLNYDGAVPDFINYLKYSILMSSGNSSQAKKFKRKGFDNKVSSGEMQFRSNTGRKCHFNFCVRAEE